jgi:hypothetical protein
MEAYLSGFLKGVSQVAGIVATVAMFIPGGQPVAAVASAVAVVAGVGAQITAKRPPIQGSTTNITIGANMPSPYIMGEAYYGGSRVHLVGYGTQNDVPNAYLLAVDVYGVGGPYNALIGTYLDFAPVSFSGDAAVGHYSNDTLYRDYQLGETPEGSALTPHWSGAPDWGSGYKLSGKPAIAWNARFPKDGKRWGSGFAQTGAVWQGVLIYDMRLDGTYPGGSGAHRWADPADKVSFAAAKATWVYSTNPALHALRYALGSWERDETDTDAEYQKVFGIGLDWDGIVVADFAELANVCDDNGWTCNGVIFEPGDKWANLKSILQAGGAEPCFRNGRLGLRINTPRVSLDTITVDDIADECSFPAMQSYRDRLNTIIPKYISPAHKWESVASNPVQVLDYVEQDGEEKAQELTFNLVTNADQAAQLAGYALVCGREAGPIELVCKPRLRGYGPGDMLTLGQLGAGEQFDGADCIVLKRTVDPATMKVSLTLVTEDTAKHEYALSLTGTSPPAITITPPEDRDDVSAGNVPTAPDAGDWSAAASTEIVAIVVTGDPPSDITEGLTGIQFESRVDGETEWTGGTMEGPETVNAVILGLLPDTDYEVAVRYQNTTGFSDRLILGPITTSAADIDYDGGDAGTEA